MDEVTKRDEGKPVIDANGDYLGTVERVEDGTAFVDPHEDIPALAKRVLGWREGVCTLTNIRIDAITDERIHLRGNL